MTWDYDDTALAKQAKADPVWHMERLIRHGLNGKKLNRRLLKKYLCNLQIPEDRRAFLELLIWKKPF